MHSPGHRTNLLNPQVDHVGVAVVAGRDGLYAVADYERAVLVLTQSQQESEVAGLVKANGIAILPDPTLARTACSAKGTLPRPASGPRPRFALYWKGAQLTQLPPDLVNELATGKYHQAAVGSCSSQSKEDAFTSYRIAVLLY